MRKDILQTPLTDKNLKAIKPENVVAITMASNGAMGDPGAVEITDKKLDVYYTHLGEISSEKLKRIIPFIEKIDDIFANIWTGGKVEIDGDWTGIYTGFGNCLFVRPELKEPMLDYIKANYTECSPTVELYTHWYDALKEVVGADTK